MTVITCLSAEGLRTLDSVITYSFVNVSRPDTLADSHTNVLDHQKSLAGVLSSRLSVMLDSCNTEVIITMRLIAAQCQEFLRTVN